LYLKNRIIFFFYLFISFCLLFFSFHFLHISLFRFVFVDFVSFRFVSFRFYFVSHFIGTHFGKGRKHILKMREKITEKALFLIVFILCIVFFYIYLFNMKQTRPWMLANLKIIWQFHAHPVHQKVSRFCGPRYIGYDFLLGPNLVSFNRTVVPYEISKVNFRVETKIVVSMSEEI
jgi:hypothetical protein